MVKSALMCIVRKPQLRVAIRVDESLFNLYVFRNLGDIKKPLAVVGVATCGALTVISQPDGVELLASINGALLSSFMA